MVKIENVDLKFNNYEKVSKNKERSLTVGMKSVRELSKKNASLNPQFLQPTKESARLGKIKEETSNYLLEKVDPLLTECITWLLCEQPTDVTGSMLHYFKGKAEGNAPQVCYNLVFWI